jgi:hypothetical protein
VSHGHGYGLTPLQNFSDDVWSQKSQAYFIADNFWVEASGPREIFDAVICAIGKRPPPNMGSDDRLDQLKVGRTLVAS